MDKDFCTENLSWISLLLLVNIHCIVLMKDIGKQNKEMKFFNTNFESTYQNEHFITILTLFNDGYVQPGCQKPFHAWFPHRKPEHEISAKKKTIVSVIYQYESV